MICPSCHNDQVVTEHQYGALYTCKSCQAVYFISFDGNPEFGEVQAYEPEALSEALPTDTLPPTNLPEFVADLVNEFQSPLQNEGDPMQPLVQFNQNEFAVPESTDLETPAISFNQFSDVAKDISDYGNTETQIAHLNYDLRIKGLDTAEMMSSLKEVIEDSRFGWDSNELMRTIKHGEISFEKLNPVKAYILAKRLQFLDVEKIWKQNAVG